MSLSLMIDSGAYSVWTKGETIDIDEYIEFVRKDLDCIDYVVNLDVIPGTCGCAMKKPGMWRQIASIEQEKSAEQGFRNYYYMLERGIPKEKLLHLFHQGEDFKWLRRMMNEVDYIGLSPANDLSVKNRIQWLDRCMHHVLDEKKRPKVKFHGFGITARAGLTRFPWYSLDSSQWRHSANNGFLLYVPKVRGRRTYGSEPITLKVSNRIKARNDPYHIECIKSRKPTMYKDILEYLEELGVSLGESRFRKEDKSYRLQKNEVIALPYTKGEKKALEQESKILVEEIIEEAEEQTKAFEWFKILNQGEHRVADEE